MTYAPLSLKSPVLSLLLLANSAYATDTLNLRWEVKAHYRDSEHNQFSTQFPFPPEALPVGESSAFLETVDSGQTAELSTINVSGKWLIHPEIAAHFKIEAIDKYERNPTSTDHKIGLDFGFIRYGDRSNPLQKPDQSTVYAQLGKFTKFERQKARRTESYGLVSTAFNRFEDSGLEFGFDLSAGFYSRFSLTTGNPVFIRDPNALAGDNGTKERRTPPNNPDPKLKSGIVILYDAEIESFDPFDNPEYGLGLGYRWESADQHSKLDILAFGYERELANNRSLHGTFYGADLDLLDLGEVPGAGGIRLPVNGKDKLEYGINLWYQLGNFELFTQIVDQDLASLDRLGKEIELSYVIDSRWPVSLVLRYSELDADFTGHPAYPAPSVWWDWEKIDYGINIDLTNDIRLTLEYADNCFIRANQTESNNETLLTVRWHYQ